MLKFHNIQQNTDEWLEMRAGKLTGSNFGKVMANYGKAFGEPAKKLAINIAIEQLTGEPIPSNYTNEHMQRGHEQEPVARMIYEDQTFSTVDNGGFFSGEFIGMSPDGLVDDSGVIEIKSVLSNIHFANIKRGCLDPGYKWQCIGNLYFSGRDWIDFISYCESFPSDKKLFVHRLNKEDLNDEFSMLNERIDEFKSLVEKCKETINSSDYFKQ